MTLARRAMIGAAIGLVALLLLRTFVVGIYAIPSVSMAPTLLAGDWLLVSRRIVRIERGQIVVFDLAGQSYVKRVIGLPGDRIAMREGRLRINETLVETEPLTQANLDADGAPAQTLAVSSYVLERENWLTRQWTVARFRGVQSKDGAWVVPEDRLFVVGDNRDNSVDSRDASFAFVPVSSVTGRVVRVLWSSGPDGARSDRRLLPVN